MDQQQLPGAGTALTMGIVSIVTSIFCCGPFAAIFSIIGLSNAKSAEKLYQQNPDGYTGYENAKTGKTLSYIGLAISIIMLVLGIIYFGVIIALITSGEFNID
ncbi:CCC motif membrane protein [Maribacter algicola]|uniref:CCC motif membrane protein n=1 Tax=Meishania litoralis TaxID=3434685 RepID=A0ACC7LT15_9FLAO